MGSRTGARSAQGGAGVDCPACGFPKASDALACRRCGKAPASLDQPIGVWRDKKLVVALNDAPLPARCVKCGDVCHSAPLSRQVRWMNQTKMLLLFLVLGILLVFVYPFMKRLTVTASFCDTHLAKRGTAKRRSLNLAIASAVLLLAAILTGKLGLLIVAIPALIIAAIWGGAQQRLLYVRHHDDLMTKLGGADKSFLKTLPQWPGPAALTAAARQATS